MHLIYIGIETTKLAQKLVRRESYKIRTRYEESVASAYFLILVSEKSLELLNGNIANLKKHLNRQGQCIQVGMAESTDVDQMVSNVTMVENTRSSLERTIELNYNLLRFQLGCSSNNDIILTETLEDLTDQDKC